MIPPGLNNDLVEKEYTMRLRRLVILSTQFFNN